MIEGLLSYWDLNFDSDDEPEVRPSPVRPERSQDLFAQLPPARPLSPLHESWLDADLKQFHSGATYVAHQRAAAMRGPSDESHRRRRQRLATLVTEVEEMGYRLPDDFVAILSSDDAVTRLRFGCHWFELPDFVCRCPLDDRFVMVLFLCEAQGCNFTHLLIGPDGGHCVTRTMHWYGQHPNPPGCDSSEEEKRIYHYADSFAEFICWSADEIRDDERSSASSYLGFGDKLRDAGEHTMALTLYQVGQSYDPGNAELATRIAQYKTSDD